MSKNLVSKFSASSHATTYALLVGVDAYPDPRHRLRGCRNDVEAMATFLEQYQGRRELQVRTLLDGEASRKGVIEAWLEFKVAKEGDVCLFYFSGHGSTGPSPDFFRHIDVNGQMQSIVCYDSRSTGGVDLTDKELSQLTWEVTYDENYKAFKKLHLVTIFDCCHAGGNTKEAERDRGIDQGVIPEEIRAFFGYEQFDRQVRRGKVFYSPKRGPHVQLAAAAEQEKAKEKVLDHKNRGLYTYLLLQTVSDHRVSLTYTQLQQALFIRLQNENERQTPQLDSLKTSVGHHSFLQLGGKVSAHSFIVSFHRELNKWLVHCGHIQGIDPSRKGDFKFFLPATDSEHSLEEVYLSHAALDNFNHPDLERVFLAEAKTFGPPSLSIGIEEALAKELSLAGLDSPYWIGVNLDQEAQCQIKKLDNQLCIMQGEQTIYRTPLPQSSEAKSALARHLQRMGKWQKTLAIANERPRIKRSQYKIEWYTVEGADGYPNEEEAPATLIDPNANQALFSYVWDQHYIEQQMAWLEPAFRLRFTNQSGKPLYLTGLYLQADFKITDRFCPSILLDSGKSIDFQYRTKSGRLYQSIFLSIYPELLKEKVQLIKEYIKLFISYKPFDVEQLKQDGLNSKLNANATTVDPSKAIGSRTDHLLGGHRDWTVETLELNIQKPKPS